MDMRNDVKVKQKATIDYVIDHMGLKILFK